MATTCRDCGAEIIWPKRESGRTAPPHEYIGQVETIIDGVLRTVPGYRRHVCEAEALDSYREAQEERPDIKVAIEDARAQAWEEARPNRCKDCGAKVGQPCWDLSARARGKTREKRWPHESRRYR